MIPPFLFKYVDVDTNKPAWIVCADYGVFEIFISKNDALRFLDGIEQLRKKSKSDAKFQELFEKYIKDEKLKNQYIDEFNQIEIDNLKKTMEQLSEHIRKYTERLQEEFKTKNVSNDETPSLKHSQP